ncbi:hypothetical protein GE09DRAFT_1054035 [Coniochaeta sp. 2T2.1]|nr:hypothetical protein GE09DRAFT_1054035 [Coniochaeta sp. 2T2.1]
MKLYALLAPLLSLSEALVTRTAADASRKGFGVHMEFADPDTGNTIQMWVKGYTGPVHFKDYSNSSTFVPSVHSYLPPWERNNLTSSGLDKQKRHNLSARAPPPWAFFLALAYAPLQQAGLTYMSRPPQHSQNGNKKDSDACGMKQPATFSVDAVNGPYQYCLTTQDNQGEDRHDSYVRRGCFWGLGAVVCR